MSYFSVREGATAVQAPRHAGALQERLAESHYLIKLNRRHSRIFVRQQLQRVFHRAQHPTEIVVLKCSDGRPYFARWTRTPMGIIQPYRNIGGVFDLLAWPQFTESILGWYQYARRMGRKCLVLATDHYSRGDTKRGCAGHYHDDVKAFAQAEKLTDQFLEVFKDRKELYPVHCSMETDLEALVLNGKNGERVDLAGVTDMSIKAIGQMLRDLYPDMCWAMINDFAPLVKGNIEHIAEVRADQNRNPAIDAQHREWVLGFGRGFDWLHEGNAALIVGPFDPNRREVLAKAAKLAYGNFLDGRTGGREIVIHCSAFFRDGWKEVEPKLKAAEVLTKQKEVLEVIEESVPELLEHSQVLTTVVDMNTRKFHPVLTCDRARKVLVA